MCVKSWSEVQREKRERKSSKPKVKKVAKASFRRKEGEGFEAMSRWASWFPQGWEYHNFYLMS